MIFKELLLNLYSSIQYVLNDHLFDSRVIFFIDMNKVWIFKIVFIFVN